MSSAACGREKGSAIVTGVDLGSLQGKDILKQEILLIAGQVHKAAAVEKAAPSSSWVLVTWQEISWVGPLGRNLCC